jgi:TatD DNase family protein
MRRLCCSGVRMYRLIDTHCHFDAPEFAVDRADVWARASAVGVSAMVVPAVRFADFAALAELAQHAWIHPAYGLHPIMLAEHTDRHLVALADWLSRHPAVAVGEFGLDFFVAELDRERQYMLFHAQLDIAEQFKLPVILHARRAHQEVIQALRARPNVRGVIHSFAGSHEELRLLLRQDFYIGLGGPVTYPRASKLREIAKTVPLDRLLLETDAPDQPLFGRQGQRNEPALIFEVARCIAELRGIAPDLLATACNQNAQRLFSLER